ncbi:DUF5686 and carboxypeptidase regulatory-like domain-containing protein [Hufsiella ginkgonis]|uniref:Carboxypeptidase-like regulatory domain-containing protein n=1 Tax=Hufsiella ginkgonis TaxID=2695274 RepID=A0A7K1Y1L7_9SPHI|nr:DUF5686 and carboxypeptidase regulatory-like domain-containing protein [Hufsiella ginkgonis]MXV17143.1 carboxypeptidase-like regulatory domain-containing protein [Hufsiella ginkgonis]
MRQYLFIFVLLLYGGTCMAQKVTVSGRVMDENGKPLPFGSIAIHNTTKGTAANDEGFYQYTLDKGTYELAFRFIGYKTQLIRVELQHDTELNVNMVQEFFKLDTIVLGSAQDPAVGIMRRAINLRKTRLNEVKSYSTDVYIKGVQKLVHAPKKFLGEDVAAVLNLDSSRRGLLYLSESESKLYYKHPDRFREVMTASKISGKNESLSFNKATDLYVNFYQNLVQMDELAIRGFVSPLADFAFSYYKYKLLGTSVEDGETIYKIQVIPRRAHDPVFQGTLYIANGTWRLQSVDLRLTRTANINFVDTLTLNQQFIPVTGDVWMPSSLQLSFKGKVLGFSFEGYFLGIYSNYLINANLSDKLFNGEILKIVTDVRQKDEGYWADKRPVPLTREETLDYVVKDSVEKIMSSRRYKDSVDAESNKLTFLKLAAFGYTKTSTVHHTEYNFSPVLPGIFYNTVEGFGYYYQASFKKEYNLKNSLNVTTRLRYGLSNRHFNPSVEARYYYDPVNLGFLSMKLGAEVLDISNLRSSVSVTNSINTLIYETNFRKFYEKRMVTFNGSYEAAPGLFGTSTLEYSQRFPMLNTSTYRIIDRKNKHFSSNNPFTPDENTELFPRHDAVTFMAELDYAPAARYVTRPEGKFYEPFKYPRFVVTYRKGFNNILGSDVDFDFASFEIYQNELKLGLLGKSSYTVKVGRFLNNRQLYYPDLHHFRGNNSLIFESSLRNFHFLDLYQFSASRQFFEAHYEHNLGGFIVNKIPLIRKLRLDEIIGGGYLDQPANQTYSELFFGLQRLIFRIDYSLAFNHDRKVYNGFKLSYRLRRK